MTTPDKTRGLIVQTWKDNLRVLWTYGPEMPEQTVRSIMPWLTIVRWEYDGSLDEGMPSAEVNSHMCKLEKDLGKVERPAFCFEAYRRIGAGVREFALYVADPGAFLEEFNRYAIKDPRYPIAIKFYKDEVWSEFQTLLDDFRSVQGAPTK